MTKTETHLPGFREDPFLMGVDEFNARGEQRRIASTKRQAERQGNQAHTKYLTELGLVAISAGLIGAGIVAANQRVYGHNRIPATPVDQIDQSSAFENSFIDRNGNIQKVVRTADYNAYKESSK